MEQETRVGVSILSPRFERCMVPVGVHISLVSKCGYLRK